VRGKPEKFADHYTQATLFWNSQTDVEKQHIINAFRFELSRVQTPAIRERMVSGLMNVAGELAEAVASGLGIREMPSPMPKALPRSIKPEVRVSPALSMFARPGDAGVRARRRCEVWQTVSLPRELFRVSCRAAWDPSRPAMGNRSKLTSASRPLPPCSTTPSQWLVAQTPFEA
jgi:hypothetical protein